MRFFTCILSLLITGIVSAQCTFSLGPDISYCQGQAISSVLTAPAGQSSYAWSTGATTQSITANAVGVYTCTVTVLSSNLVTNSNFSSGSTGFSSDYSVGTGGTWGPLSTEGTYYITNSSSAAHSNFPFFSGHGGSGNMMVVNGSATAGASVWCQSITVTANTNYNFSAWVATCIASNSAELADLQFSINGVLMGSAFSPPLSSGVWSQFNATWNSGANTTATICIVNQNTTLSGNDFAIDDIFFQQVCTASDNVAITVKPKPTMTAPTSTTVCNGTAIAATSFTSNPAGATFAWNNSNISIGLTGSGTGDVPVFTATNTGASAISGVIGVVPTLNGCTGNTYNYTVTVSPPPVLDPVSSQTICVNNNTAAVSFNSTPPGATVNWTNSDASIGLTSSGTGNIGAFPGQNAGSTPVTGSIIATPSAGSCIGTAITFDYVVSPGPIVSAVTSQTVCEGTATTAISFNTNPAGITTVNWSNSDPGIGLAASGSGDVASFAASNGTGTTLNAVISAIPSLGTCTGTPETFTITVDPAPVLTPVTSQTVCTNSSTSAVSFASTPTGSTVNWVNSDASIGLAASGTGDITAFTGQNSGASALTGSITATPTLNGCTGLAINFDYIISPAPTLSAISSQTVCEGSSGTAITYVTNPPGIATIDWTNTTPSIGLAATGTGDISSFTATNGTGAALNAVITATPSIGVCVGAAETFTITVDPAPTATPVSNSVVCNTDAVPASSFAGTGSSYNWTNSNTGIGLGANGTGDYASFTANNTSSAAELATITVTPVLNGCNGSPISYTITVNPTPGAPIDVPVNPYCQNSAAGAITAVPFVGGSLLWWGTDATGGTSSVTAPIPSTTVAGTTTYYVSQSVLSCESPRTAITVTVNPLPVIIDPVDTVVCSGITVPARNFTSTPAGATLNWSNSNASIGLGTSGIGNVPAFTSNNTGTNPVNALIIVTPNLGSCAGAAISYSVTVNPLPVALVNNITACNNATVPAITWTSNPTGASYTWTNSNTSIGLSGSGSNSISSFSANNGSTTANNATINVTPTLNGCAGSSASFTITINPTPAAPSAPGASYCQNDVASQLSPNGAAYLWYNSAAGGSGSSTAPTPSTTSAGTTFYYVTQTVNSCESSRTTVTITTKNLPTATLAPVTSSCPPLCTRLALSSPDILLAHNWTLGDGSTYSGNDTVPDHCYPLSGNYTVGVTITDNNACSNTIVFPNAVMVAQVPEAAFSYGPQPTTLLDPAITFNNLSEGARPMTFQWNFGVEPGTYITEENPGYTYSEAGAYVVELIATNTFGCKDTTYRTVVIEEDVVIYIPNAFSPNGDGVNERFTAQGIGIDEKNFTMQIFNRWGERIFETNDINEGWNGKVNDKKLLDNDVFIWKIIFKSQAGDKYMKSGHVTLVK